MSPQRLFMENGGTEITIKDAVVGYRQPLHFTEILK